MRLLLDECVPRPLLRDLISHDAHHVVEMGWSSKRNGELLKLVVAERFETLLTVDQNLPFLSRKARQHDDRNRTEAAIRGGAERAVIPPRSRASLEDTMRRSVIRVAMAIALTGAGWSVGKAQTTVADFEMTIDAPGGRTNITCTRGCDFKFDVGSTAGLPTNTRFTYACGAERCGVTINGHGHVMR